MGNVMEILLKDGDVSETEIKDVHSWIHMFAEFQEAATCGNERERRRGVGIPCSRFQK